MSRHSFAVAALAVCGCVAGANAERIDLLVYENASGGDISLLDLWVDVSQSGALVTLDFHNDSTVNSRISNLYIERTAFTQSAFVGAGSLQNPLPSGVNFSAGGSPANPAQTIDAYDTAWGGTLASFGRNGGAANGVDPGESLYVSFTLSDANIDVAEALRNREFRVAQHVISIGAGSFSVWTTNVPAPSVASAMLGGLVLAGRRRR
ncbi:MAG: hypothetical protein RBS39_03600 [Phycisphaerales bacterium]|jgi:hypothetical protein|nr:hypothetical protein [Phycisphaerales bacterium]